MNILHGFTGSVATQLHKKFDQKYKDKNFDVEYVITKNSAHFGIDKNSAHVYHDAYEWMGYSTFKKVLHIDLVKKSDLFVIAPLSANTLAKIANGICDNLLTCVARAWDFSKPFIVAPSMNDLMYSHPITQQHLSALQSWGITIIPPQYKKLYCGTYGLGAMANIDDIISSIRSLSK